MATDKRFSILTGEAGTRRYTPPGPQTAAQAAEAARWRSELAAEVRLREAAEEKVLGLQTSLERLGEQLAERPSQIGEIEQELEHMRTAVSEAVKALGAAGVQSATDVAGLHERLDREATARGQALQDLAVAGARIEALTAENARQREDATAQRTNFEQRIAAGARAPAKAVKPPSYDMVVTHRDGNNRPQTIRLTPAKE